MTKAHAVGLGLATIPAAAQDIAPNTIGGDVSQRVASATAVGVATAVAITSSGDEDKTRPSR